MKKIFLFMSLFTLIAFGANAQTPQTLNNWTTVGSAITATQSTDVNGVTNGTYAVAFTFTSQSNQDVDSDPFAVTAGATFNYTLDVFDNDAGGRVRMVIVFNDGTAPIYSYSGIYSADNVANQTLTYTGTVPTGAVTAQIRLRFYDVSANWTGSSVILIDNANYNEGAANLITNGDFESWTAAASNAISAFSFAIPAATGVVDGLAHTVAIDVPFGTNVTALVASFTLSAGATGATVGTTAQVSGTTPNDFTAPVVYTVTDGTTTQDWTVTVTILAGPTQVADIATLRAGLTDGTVYELTGEAIITFMETYRNHKFIEDATGAILVDDNAGMITTVYNQYDGLTGVTGTLGAFNNMLQFTPTADPGVATSTANVVTPQVITMTEFTTNFESYEAELVTIENATFVDAGSTFATGTLYSMTSGVDAINFRTNFYAADYISTTIPGNVNVTGLCYDKGATTGVTLTARDLNDFTPFVQYGGVDCANAIVISAGTHHAKFVTDPQTMIYEQWYSFTAPSDGSVNITNCASDADAYFTIDQGACGTSLIADQDQDLCGASSYSENYTFNVTTGTTYLIGLGNWDQTTMPTYDWDLTFTSTTPTLVINTPVEASTVTTANVNIDFTVTNFVVGDNTSTTDDGHIHYTVDGGSTVMYYTTSPIALTGLANGAHAVHLWLVDNAHADIVPAVSATVNFTVAVPVVATDVADIATLRAGLTDGTEYRLTGEAVITFMETYRNHKFIEDATGAILIDDNAAFITTVYNQYDGLTGVTGTLGTYNNMLQFTPTADPGVATSTANVVTPQIITLAQFNAGFETYEAELVTVQAVTFVDAGSTFATGTLYSMTSGADAINFRTNFYAADYIGATIPTKANVTGLCYDKGATTGITLTARNLVDIVDVTGISSLDSKSINVYPNPSNGTFVIKMAQTANLQIIDVTGRIISTQMLNASENTISIENSGIYLLRISNQNGVSTQHVIVK